jgi:hypothetical protein
VHQQLRSRRLPGSASRNPLWTFATITLPPRGPGRSPFANGNLAMGHQEPFRSARRLGRSTPTSGLSRCSAANGAVCANCSHPCRRKRVHLYVQALSMTASQDGTTKSTTGGLQRPFPNLNPRFSLVLSRSARSTIKRGQELVGERPPPVGVKAKQMTIARHTVK